MSEEPKPLELPNILYVQYDEANGCYIASSAVDDLAEIHTTETAGQYRLEKKVRLVNATTMEDAPAPGDVALIDPTLRVRRPPITLVGVNHFATGLGHTDHIKIAGPAGVRAEDVMLAYRTGIPFETQGYIMPGEPIGWTRISRVLARGDRQWYGDLYLRVAEADEPPTHVFPLIRTQGTSVGIVAYRGVDTANPIDVEASGQMGPTDEVNYPIQSPSITTTVNRGRIVVFFGIDQQAPQAGKGGEDRFIGPPSGYRELYDSYNPDNFAMGADRHQDVAGFVDPVEPSISHRTAGSSAIVALRTMSRT